MVYYAGQTSLWEPRDHAASTGRRVRFNPATGFHEAVGGGAPPTAYPSREAADASAHGLTNPPPG